MPLPFDKESTFGRRDVFGITVVLGLLGLLLTIDAPPSPSSSPAADVTPIVGDRYPSSSDSISYETGMWSDPWGKELQAKVTKKLVSGNPVSVTDLIADHLDLERSDSKKRLLIMPIVVKGGTDESSRNVRTKRRHAIELALASSAFEMRFPDRMTLKECEVEVYLSQSESTRVTFQIPVKLYHRAADGNSKGEDSYLLVIWMKEERLGRRPLATISEVIRAVLDCDEESFKARAGITICGPSFS